MIESQRKHLTDLKEMREALKMEILRTSVLPSVDNSFHELRKEISPLVYAYLEVIAKIDVYETIIP